MATSSGSSSHGSGRRAARRDADATPVPGPSTGTMLRRGLVLRCPWCGRRRAFLKTWFRRHDRCATCGIRWRREEGTELGALALNTVLTFAALAIAMGVGFVLTVPDIPVVPFVASLAAVAILMPVVIYPFTYTVWLAVDLRVHPPDRAEMESAAAAVGPTPPSPGAPRPPADEL